MGCIMNVLWIAQTTDDRRVRTETPTQYVPFTTCRRHIGSDVARPIYIRVILNFSFKNLLALKYHPGHKNLFAKLQKNAIHHHSSPFEVPSLLDFFYNGLFLCFELDFAVGSRFLDNFSGYSRLDPWLAPPRLMTCLFRNWPACLRSKHVLSMWTQSL